MAAKMVYCSKCGKTMAETNFYTYKDGTKAELCKACLTMHINNWDPQTFLWLLEQFDIPYIESEWNTLRDRAYQKDPYKMTGMSVFGKYLSKLKLRQFKGHDTWADTEYWKQKAEEDAVNLASPKKKTEAELEEMRIRYENGEITESQYQTYAAIKAPTTGMLDPTSGKPMVQQGPYPVNQHPFTEVNLPDVGAELTDEDKLYLATKWGQLYTPTEWVSLEQLYKEFMNSFDIQGAARIDTLKMICKTSLKMNNAIDSGDIDTYQKLSKVYDAMMKSAKFTEAQRKEERSGDFDSVGQIVYFAEKNKGKIPRYDVSKFYDGIDEKMDNLKRYNRELISNDTALAQMIENYIKRREAAESQKRDLQEAEEKGFDYVPITNDDYSEFNDFIENEQAEGEIKNES